MRYVPDCSYTADTNKSVVNIRKSQALCINTQHEVIAGLQDLGIETQDYYKHLGLYLSKNIQDTIAETLQQIYPKALTAPSSSS
jgi:hypothetical protein